MAKQVYDGVISQKVLDSFTGIVKKSSRKIIQDKLKDKIQTAFGTNQKQEQLSEIPEPEKEAEDTEKYVTTDDEKQAFYIVRAILAGTSHVSDIVARDRKTYFSVIYKDNGRKPICRFYFNSDKVRYFSYFDEEKNEIKVPIVNLEEIYDHADKLIHVVNHYKREQDAPRVESSV